MNIKEILSVVDHTLLKQESSWEQIKEICDDGIAYKTASVCIPPCYVKQVYEYVKGQVAICTVIGFPNGNSTTAAKCFEAAEAVENGAQEIDMVVNIGWIKDCRYDEVLDEINQVKAACKGKLLKVIIETCLLTREEKINMCKVVSESNADFIKTSTGFSTMGATFEDIELFSKNIADKKIKAAGGISSISDAEQFIKLGADRLGTSRIVNIVKNKKQINEY